MGLNRIKVVAEAIINGEGVPSMTDSMPTAMNQEETVM